MTSNDNGMIMPVAPTGFSGNNNDGFGFNGGWWIILLLAVLGWGNGGFGFGGMGGGFGNMMLGYDFPWLLNGQQGINANTNAGFNQAATASALGDIQGALNTGFGNVQTALCSGFAGVNATVNGAQNAIAQQLNTNEIANLNRSFAEQAANMQGFNGLQNQLAQCCCDNRAATADVKYTIATEACANRAAGTANTQAILDKLCQLELDGVKGELAAANNTINELRTQLLVSKNETSQTAQTAQILAGQSAEVDALYNRLNNCPVPTTPVYGRTPIFTCQNNGCGCGCSNGSF